ncbi:MAG TPA: hypothetical protein V6D47_02220 [Oscillatoriaceae cyanobacterium]
MKIASASQPTVRPSAAIAAKPTPPSSMSGDVWTPTPPLNPFRPLFGATTSLESAASQGGFASAFAAVGLLATVPADLADAVTRPLQLLVWPFAYAWYGVTSVSRLLRPKATRQTRI